MSRRSSRLGKKVSRAAGPILRRWLGYELYGSSGRDEHLPAVGERTRWVVAMQTPSVMASRPWPIATTFWVLGISELNVQERGTNQKFQESAGSRPILLSSSGPVGQDGRWPVVNTS